MCQVLMLLAAALAVVSGRPGPERLDVEPGSPQYRYQYGVNVPETGDQKSHTEQRDEAGVVVGNFQVVDPTGDLRKLFYRVEGNSGFVITDQQVMVGFTERSRTLETNSRRQATVDGAQGEDDSGQPALVTSTRDAGQSEDSVVSFRTVPRHGAAGGLSGSNDFTPGNGELSFLNEEISSSGGNENPLERDSSEGLSSEAGSSDGGPSSFEQGSGVSESGAFGADGQNSQSESVQPITFQIDEELQVKPFKFDGPAFTFTIKRTEPNRFDVTEQIIGHAVEFSTHGGRARRFASDLP